MVLACVDIDVALYIDKHDVMLVSQYILINTRRPYFKTQNKNLLAKSNNEEVRES